MEKNLLFIRGIYDTIDLFIEAFTAAFTSLGCACHTIDVRDEKTAMARLRGLIEAGTLDGVITFNNIGYNLSFTGGTSIWDEKSIPYFNILMDHPFHYSRPLEHAPKSSVIFCTDLGHVSFLRRFYPNLKQVDFMPHAGMEADLSEYGAAGACHLCTDGDGYHPPLKERPFDVLYAGSLSKYVAEGLIPDLGEIKDFDAFTLTQEVLSDLIRCPYKTTEQAVEEYLLSIGKQYTDRELNQWITGLRFIDSYATSFFREQAVRLLVEKGLKVTVFGSGWEQCEWADNPNLILGGKVLAPQVLELMNHSRIVLNTMTWYKNGIHDRIINGMLAKAVVLTDESLYLKNGILARKEPCLEAFSLQEIHRLPELAEGLLGHPGRMEEIAENGYLAAKEGHTWLQRAEFIYAKYLQG